MIEATLRQMAAESPDREICGFLMWDGTIIPAQNIADKNSEFELDHATTVEVYQSGGAIRGVYHSHPSGCDYPSWEDVRNNPIGLTCIIVTLANCVEWVVADDKSSVTRSSAMAGQVRKPAAVS